MVKTWAKNVAYCTKEMGDDWSKVHGNIPEASKWKPHEKAVFDAYYTDVVWRPWQQQVIDIVEGPIDPRRVYWFWEPEGNSGKSFLMRYLYLQYECIVGGGKQADVFHQVAKRFENGASKPPTLILLDIPRSSQKYCSYAAIEALKNGFVNSGKYEGDVCVFLEPHVLVFANQEPDYAEMSEDRWHVRRLRRARTVVEALKNV